MKKGDRRINGGPLLHIGSRSLVWHQTKMRQTTESKKKSEMISAQKIQSRVQTAGQVHIV